MTQYAALAHTATNPRARAYFAAVANASGETVNDEQSNEIGVSRPELIEALSWAEDMERGRWGIEHATAVLEAHEARIKADALREAADAMEQFEPFPGEEPDWLRERADALCTPPEGSER